MKRLSANLLIAAQYIRPPKRWEFWAMVVLGLTFFVVLVPYAVWTAKQANESYYSTFEIDNGR